METIPQAIIDEAKQGVAEVQQQLEGERKEKKVKQRTKKVAKKDPASALVAKVNGARAGSGPGTLRFKFKPARERGKCDILGCKRGAHEPKAFRCEYHKREVRKAQLTENNRVWRQRVARGKAGHHLSYKGKPTVYALLHPEKAVQEAQKRGIMPAPKLKVAIKRELKALKAYARTTK